jgi:hypothetical protein
LIDFAAFAAASAAFSSSRFFCFALRISASASLRFASDVLLSFALDLLTVNLCVLRSF